MIQASRIFNSCNTELHLTHLIKGGGGISHVCLSIIFFGHLKVTFFLFLFILKFRKLDEIF